MTTKIKYFSFSSLTSLELKKIISFLRTQEFAGEKSQGFLIDEIQPTTCFARFIQRNEFIEEVIDPLGKKLEIQRIEYDEVPFSIHSTWPHVEVYDQYRLSGLVLNKIASSLGFDRSLTALDDLNFKTLFLTIKKLYNSSFVESLLIGDIALSTKTLARLQLDGSEDVRKYIKNIFKGKAYTILAARITLTVKTQNIKARFDHGGKIEISGLSKNELLPIFRQLIRESQFVSLKKSKSK